MSRIPVYASLASALCAMIFLFSTVPLRSEDGAQVPYWATISADKAYLRVGPGHTFRIAWVYRRANLPVKVVRREGPWRLIEDPSGTQGWMRDLLLSRKRGAIVTGKGLAEMRSGEGGSGTLAWKLQPGVNGLLGECKQGWCAFDAGGHKGYAPQDRLWGANAP